MGAGTYKTPRPKMPIRPIFWLRLIWSDLMKEEGMHRIAMSDRTSVTLQHTYMTV